jgi:hypothetical protein
VLPGDKKEKIVVCEKYDFKRSMSSKAYWAIAAGVIR